MRPCNLKRQQRDLMPVLRRPVEPAIQHRTYRCTRSRSLALLLDRPQPIGFGLVGVPLCRRRDQLRAFRCGSDRGRARAPCEDLGARAKLTAHCVPHRSSAVAAHCACHVRIERSCARSSGSCEACRKRGDRATPGGGYLLRENPLLQLQAKANVRLGLTATNFRSV